MNQVNLLFQVNNFIVYMEIHLSLSFGVKSITTVTSIDNNLTFILKEVPCILYKRTEEDYLGNIEQLEFVKEYIQLQLAFYKKILSFPINSKYTFIRAKDTMNTRYLKSIDIPNTDFKLKILRRITNYGTHIFI